MMFYLLISEDAVTEDKKDYVWTSTSVAIASIKRYARHVKDAFIFHILLPYPDTSILIFFGKSELHQINHPFFKPHFEFMKRRPHDLPLFD